MSTDYAEFHDELRAVARQLLAPAGDSDAGLVGEPPVTEWQPLVDAGFTGLEVPPALGGAGATFAESAVVLEEMGRATAQTAFVGSVLGVGALPLLEPSEARDRLLEGIAAGGLQVAVVLPIADEPIADEPTGDEAAIDTGFELEPQVSGGRLTGRAAHVLDALTARLLLVPARTGDTVTMVVIDAQAPGVAVEPQPVVDATRQLATVTADGALVEAKLMLPFSGDPAEGCRRLRDRGAMAVACDSLGLAAEMLEATVAYASVRQQFGRPIGSFQAVQHACADMLVQTSMARELVANGVAAVAAGDPDGWVAVSMAKSFAAGAAVDIAGKAMQLHGGMGYTWESGIHTYLKRAVLNRTLFGSPRAHRRQLGDRYLTAIPPGRAT